MGICCTRNEQGNEEVLSLSLKNDINENFCHLRYPELYFESTNYQKGYSNTNLNLLFSSLDQVFLTNTKKITLIELYNISLLYCDNHTNSNYLVYDFRSFNMQKENFIKKMRHINYSYDELKIMSIDKLENFKRFINNKNIIFILPEGNKNCSFSAIMLLTELKIDFTVNILNTSLLKSTLSPHTIKLLDFLDKREYNILPYIFFCFSHLNFTKKEGFGFLNLKAFNDDDRVEISLKKFVKVTGKSKDNENINNQCDNRLSFTSMNNKSKIILNLIECFNITTVIHMVNEDIIKEEDFSANSNNSSISNNNNSIVYKEIEMCCEVGDLIKRRLKIKELCEWVKNEMMKGHSFEIDIGDEDIIKNLNWIFFAILIIWEITEVSPIVVINYLISKGVYTNGIKDKIANNIHQINTLLFSYGLTSEIAL